MTRKIIGIFLFLSTLAFSCSSFAILSMELTQGVSGAIPIAVVPFAEQGGAAPQNVSNIIGSDLKNSGRFKVFGKDKLSDFPTTAREIPEDAFRRMGVDNVVVGHVEALGNDRYQVSFQLVDIYNGTAADKVVSSQQYTVSGRELRAVSHHISDLIYQRITGVRGIFSTRIVYVVVKRDMFGPKVRYSLEVADQDGENPRPLLNSPQPIMSPSWAPNGRQIAYVSFEKHRAGIYIQDVTTGARRLLSQFPGINGAPSWSPDGRQLALVLSKSGAPNVYVMDIASRQLTQITHDFYINTEPAWSPSGRSLLFTSNRSGGPQLYEFNRQSHAVTRLTYDGNYNARGAYTKDGKSIAMIHRVSGGVYKIAMLDLDTGNVKVLNSAAGDSASPSIAPNSSMILYDTVAGGTNMLGMVSADGRVQLVLPSRNGEAQDPAWSPFLS